MNDSSGRPLSIHHIGIAVASIADAHQVYELVTGARCSGIEEVSGQGVRVAFVGALELLEPTSADSTVARFLERRGPGLHHLAYRVDDLPAELERLSSAGVSLIDHVPRRGAHGHSVAFLHPRSTNGTLVELVQE